MNMKQTCMPSSPQTHFYLTAVSLDATSALNIALAQSRCKSISRQIFSMWPNLKTASINLAGMLSALYPGTNHDLLLASTIKKAFTAFRTGEGKDVERASEFLSILLTASDGIIKYRLYGYKDKSNYILWEPFSEPIDNWVRNNEIISIAWEESNQEHPAETFQWILAGKIFTYSDSELVLKFKKKPKKTTPTLRIVVK